jgi:hypothetical protein
MEDSKQKDIKNFHVQAVSWFCNWHTRYVNADIYSCIALVQLLYRWIPEILDTSIYVCMYVNQANRQAASQFS